MRLLGWSRKGSDPKGLLESLIGARADRDQLAALCKRHRRSILGAFDTWRVDAGMGRNDVESSRPYAETLVRVGRQLAATGRPELLARLTAADSAPFVRRSARLAEADDLVGRGSTLRPARSLKPI